MTSRLHTSRHAVRNRERNTSCVRLTVVLLVFHEKLEMNNSYYKYCIVPECKNTTLKTPDKLFIYVPNNKKVRKQWLTLAGRSDADDLSTVSRMYFCEDHFDLPNDMVNYMEYYIMGKVSQVRLKAGCTPKKFVCQGDGRKRTGSTKRTNKKAKKQTKIAECPDESKQGCICVPLYRCIVTNDSLLGADDNSFARSGRCRAPAAAGAAARAAPLARLASASSPG
ncbi:hypothetical protein MSG28_014714 [Choristoneura fumiferana]|uniref:Uncharacterized protein n=1 Tax=Choristoneura fumiferana TaxID=7141 RepID=A0ACC0JT06_CHOFU|nr:hypothetical protein MSG28_014714 [Choristoneura fumiferana]